MKKILLTVLIVLLLGLTYIVFYKGIDIGFLKIDSINGIKNSSSKLNEDFAKADELASKTYPSEIGNLEEQIRQLKISKQEYENKKKYTEGNEEIGSVEIKTYTIHYLWTILGNYRQSRGVDSLKLDLKSTQTEDVYDLQFTLVGSYISITDFLYSIEDDEQLNFEIKNLNISSGTRVQQSIDEETDEEETTGGRPNNILSNNESKQNTTNNESTEENNKEGYTLTATFTVENVGITLE